MSPQEARWWGRRSAELLDEGRAPILNIGSSTKDYRTKACPEIDEYIFAPLRKAGVTLHHIDMKQEEGVDLVGDITDEAFRKEIRALHPGAIFCNNFLEHVADRQSAIDALSDMVDRGGYLFLSVPQHYPYCPDPIDNGYRVSPKQLAEAFPGFATHTSESVKFGNYLSSLIRSPKLLVRDAYLMASGFLKREKWKVLRGNYSYLVRPYSVACVVLRKN